MKLFPAKISERATLQKMTSEGNNAMLPSMLTSMLTDDRRYSEV